jgi:hypothetical protein
VIEGEFRVYIQDRVGTKKSQLLETGDFGLVRMQAAAQQHNMQFMPDFDWSDAR